MTDSDDEKKEAKPLGGVNVPKETPLSRIRIDDFFKDLGEIRKLETLAEPNKDTNKPTRKSKPKK